MDFDPRALRPAAQAAGVPEQEVIDVVTAALKDAYDATPGAQPGVNVTLDVDAGTLTLALSDGTRIDPPGWGARATTAARQAIVSWARNRQRLAVVGPWAGREGTALLATVKMLSKDREVRLDIDGAAAVMPAGEAINGEHMWPGKVVQVLLLAANATDRGTVRLTVSRRQPALVAALFAQQLKAARSSCTITSVAREPGVRSKVACTGPVPDPRVDVIGEAGAVVRVVQRALEGERVDVVAHSEDLAEFVAAALSPARVEWAKVVDPARRVVHVGVRPEDRPAVEGAAGVNLRLAGRLTGARIELVAP